MGSGPWPVAFWGLTVLVPPGNFTVQAAHGVRRPLPDEGSAALGTHEGQAAA